MFSQGILCLHKRLAVTEKTSVYILIFVVGSVCIFNFIYLSTRHESVHERRKHVFPLYRYIHLTVDHNDTALRSPVCLKPNQRQFVMLWYGRPVWIPEVDPFSSLKCFCECQNCKVTFNTTNIVNSDLCKLQKGALDSQLQVIKLTSCFTMAGSSLRVPRFLSSLKLVTMIWLKYC